MVSVCKGSFPVAWCLGRVKNSVCPETGQLKKFAVVQYEMTKECQDGVKVPFVLVVVRGPGLWFHAFSLLYHPKKLLWGTVAMVFGVSSCVSLLWSMCQVDSVLVYLLQLTWSEMLSYDAFTCVGFPFLPCLLSRSKGGRPCGWQPFSRWKLC